jgi:hypothetical protein
VEEAAPVVANVPVAQLTQTPVVHTVANLKFSVCIEMLFSNLNILERPAAVAEAVYTCIGIMGEDEDMDTISKKYKLQLLK